MSTFTLQQEKKMEETEKVLKLSTQNFPFDKAVSEPMKVIKKQISYI